MCKCACAIVHVQVPVCVWECLYVCEYALHARRRWRQRGRLDSQHQERCVCAIVRVQVAVC